MQTIQKTLFVLLCCLLYQVTQAQIAQTDPNRKNILVEHFSNENYFNIDNINLSLYNKLAGCGDHLSFIQYQTSYGGFDELWDQNKIDPNSRILYYSIGYANQYRWDGNINSTSTSQLDTGGFYAQSLISPDFQIQLNQFDLNGNVLEISGQIEALNALPLDDYLLYVAVVEHTVPNRKASFDRQKILRNMLPDAAGKQFSQSWAVNDNQPFSYTWNIPNNVYDPTDLGVVIFIQNKNTKDIYQSLSYDSGVQPSQFSPLPLIQGTIYEDLNLDCNSTNDPTLGDWMVKLQSNNELAYAKVDANGYYSFVVNTGTYYIEVLPPNDYWQTCVGSQLINIGTNQDTLTVDFTAQAITNSTDLMVDISTPYLERCFSGQYYVRYFNKGTVPAPNAYVDIDFDSDLTVANSTLPFSLVNNGSTHRFYLGNLASGTEGKFSVEVQVNCNAVDSKAHCTEAIIRSDSLPTPLPNPAWDNANLETNIECLGDSVLFRIQNTGTGPQGTTTRYIIAEDEVMLHTQDPQILNGQSVEYIIPADGSTYYIATQQSEEHPYKGLVASVYEGCGIGTISTGIVEQYEIGDRNPMTDITCFKNASNITPNVLHASPRGYSNRNFINADAELEYQIHFQNTSSDTAYVVVIEQEISSYLDIESICLGAHSHEYTLEIADENTIRFIFNNINLPNDQVDPLGSNGFVSFKIRLQDNVPLGTVLDAQSTIYFDYEIPIISPIIQHEIASGFIQTQFISNQLNIYEHGVQVYPNPFSESTSIEIIEPIEVNEIILRIFDKNGAELRQEIIQNQSIFQFHRQDLAPGLYFYSIESDGKILDGGKLSVQ